MTDRSQGTPPDPEAAPGTEPASDDELAAGTPLEPELAADAELADGLADDPETDAESIPRLEDDPGLEPRAVSGDPFDGDDLATDAAPATPRSRRARGVPTSTVRPPSPSEIAVHVREDISKYFVIAAVAVFTIILLNGLLLGNGGLITGTPTPTPEPTASPAPSVSVSPSASASASASAGTSASPAPDGSAAPSASPSAAPSAVPSASPAPS